MIKVILRIIFFAIAIGLVAYFSIGRNYARPALEVSSQIASSTVAGSGSNDTIANWKSFKDVNLGVTLRYPPEYNPWENPYTGTELSLHTPNESKWIDIIQETIGSGCYGNFCDRSSKKQLTVGALVWDDVGAPQGIDLDPAKTYEGWRTTIGTCHYYVTFVEEGRQTEFLSHLSIEKGSCGR